MDELVPARATGATVAATATAVPPYLLTRDDVRTYIRSVFAIDARRADALATVVDNAQIHKRHAVAPIEQIIQRRSLAETSRVYQRQAVALGQQVARSCLER